MRGYSITEIEGLGDSPAPTELSKALMTFVLSRDIEEFLDKQMCSEAFRDNVIMILRNAGFSTLEKLLSCTPKQLRRYRGLGFKRICYIQASLQKHGFELDEGGFHTSYVNAGFPFGANWRQIWWK